MTIQEKAYTADDLWELSHRDADNDHARFELDDGELIIMSPTGDRHGTVTNWIAFLITGHVVEHDLGEVTSAETGFVLFTNPVTSRDTVRAPDFGFIAKARLMPMTGKYYRFAPDLAVEVVSPIDTARYIRRKANQFLQAGTRLQLIVYPDDDEKFIDVYRPNQPIKTFKGEDVLDCGDVLPGFSITANDVFKRLR